MFSVDCPGKQGYCSSFNIGPQWRQGNITPVVDVMFVVHVVILTVDIQSNEYDEMKIIHKKSYNVQNQDL